MRTNHEERIDIDTLCDFTDKQKEASRLVKRYKYVLYGGAMGGGKSYFLRWKLLRMLLAFAARGHYGVVVGLFCEDYPALKDRHISKIKQEFPAWLGEYSATDHTFTLYPEFGGGILALRNLDDASKYQSVEFAVIAIDELTKNTEEDFLYLRMRLRWPGFESETRFIAATNPGGKGHLWVKNYWLDRAYPDNERERDQFVYLQALLKDNPHIYSQEYMRALESLPLEKRRAFLEGDWNIFEGQFFSEWDPKIHVVAPFEISPNWRKFRSIDVSGREGITSCHWYALDHDGRVWVYREHYGKGLDADQHARIIAKMSEDRYGSSEEYVYTIIDSSAFAHSGLGETFASIYERNGVYGLMPSSRKARISGWNIVHQYLRSENGRKPKLQIFSTCTNMIRTLPSLIHDDKNPEDVNTASEDHAADELRYFLETLYEQKTPPPENPILRRLRALRDVHPSWDYSYGAN